MTKAELDAKTQAEREYYFEWEYPFNLPENEAVDVLNPALLEKLSPLETAYVRWMMETYNRDLAIDKFIHPAFYFDKANFGASYLKTKGHVTDVLRQIRRECPYMKLYTGDYITGILHDEIQYLRSQNRKDRFYGPSANPANLVSKKSPHDQEMEEIDRLLACLKQIHDLKMAAGGFNGSSDSQQGNTDNSFDRVVAGAKALINGGKNGESRGA